MTSFEKKYGPWAVVTGAARGLGKAFAEALAQKNSNLILVDVLTKELELTVAELTNHYPIKVVSLIMDLSDGEQINQFITICNDYNVGLFCCNHAMTKVSDDGLPRAWTDESLTNLQKMTVVNINAFQTLIYHFAKRMKQQQKGGIIIVSSGSALLPGLVFFSQYSATKAFQLHLGESLWSELGQYDVDVLTLLPGLIKTEGTANLLNDEAFKHTEMMDATTVAKLALNALGKKALLIPGWKNKLNYFIISRLLTKTFVIKIATKKMLRDYKHKIFLSKTTKTK